MRPWMVFPGIKEKKVDMRNMLNVCSVMYWALLDIIRGHCRLLPNSETECNVEYRVKVRKYPLNATGKEMRKC